MRIYKVVFAVMCITSFLAMPRAAAQGAVVPGSIVVDPSGRVVVGFVSMNTGGRSDLGVAIFSADGGSVESRRLPAPAPGVALLASGLLVDDRSITIAGCNPLTQAQVDLVAARFAHPKIVSGSGEVPALPRLTLDPVYPNPLSGSAPAMLTYSLSHETRVLLRLTDASGRELLTLRDGIYPPGEYRMSVSLSDRPSGVYFVEMVTPQERRMMKLLKQ